MEKSKATHESIIEQYNTASALQVLLRIKARGACSNKSGHS